MKIRDIFQERIFTLSNFLSLSRVLLVPLMGWFMHREQETGSAIYRYYQLAVLLVMMMTDFFDGFLARYLNQQSRLGQFLDPVADKVAVLSVGALLVVYRDYPLWVLSVVVLREAVVVTLATILFTRRDVEVRPNMFGKITVAMMALSGVVYILSFHDISWWPLLEKGSLFLIILFYILNLGHSVKTYSGHCRA
jgi:CDP-diacylglycerol--glycerol-3-phosphate 3-phosphatidyltransferase